MGRQCRTDKGSSDVNAELHEVAAVLEHNTDPIVPGNGSAIFLNVWSAPGQSTSGCVAAAQADVRRLLGWLDRARRPVCVVVAVDGG